MAVTPCFLCLFWFLISNVMGMARQSLKVLDKRSSGSQYYLKHVSVYDLPIGSHTQSLYLQKIFPNQFIQTQRKLRNSGRLTPHYKIHDSLVPYYAEKSSKSKKRFFKTQKTADMIREVIANYYSNRLDKTKNQWLYKLTSGTTKHLKGIFIGRCWDYQLKANDLYRPTSELDCVRLWDKFVNAFAYKGPCDVTTDDYRPFFHMYTENPISDKVMLWSGTREWAHAYSRFNQRFMTLEDTLAGYILNGLRWCGSVRSPGINYTACPYECTKQKAFWGLAAEKLAKRAKGVVHVMLNGTRQHLIDEQIFPAFMEDSVLAENQLPNLEPQRVTELRVLVGHSLNHVVFEKCGTFTVRVLEDRARQRGLPVTCYDNPYAIRHLLCVDSPMDPHCLFAKPLQ